MAPRRLERQESAEALPGDEAAGLKSLVSQAA